MKLGEISEEVRSDAARKQLDNLISLTKDLIDHTRYLTFTISSPVFSELGLEAAIHWLSNQVAEQHRLRCIFESDNNPKPIDENTASVLFRAVSELVFNTIKHANATEVRIGSSVAGKDIMITVEDDGIGFDLSKASSCRTGCYGIFSIRERLNWIGGRFNVESNEQRGTRATLIAPLQLSAALDQPVQSI
jgi:signal transduction histidine kinase